MASPLEIDIALWYYTRAADYGAGNGDGNFNMPAVQETFQRFVDAGLLKRHEPNADLPQRYIGTEGLRVYVEALCEMPWPEQRWVMPEPERQSAYVRTLERGMRVSESFMAQACGGNGE